MKGLLIALALLTASPAAASDIFSKPDPVDTSGESLSWTRLWGAAIGGYQMSNTGFDKGFTDGEGDRHTFLGTDGVGGEGVFGELQIGADKQLGDRAVIGVFGGASLTDSDASIGYFLGDFSTSVEEKESYFVGARAGYLISNSSMLYVGGGWMWTNVNASLQYGDSDPKTASETLDAPFAETGLEGRLNKIVGWKVFGRYTFYDDMVIEQGRYDIRLDEPGRLQFGAGLTISLN